MWLIEFHIAFSILCILTSLGLIYIGKDDIEKNGWNNGEKAKLKDLKKFFLFFCPFINVILTLSFLVLIFTKKSDKKG